MIKNIIIICLVFMVVTEVSGSDVIDFIEENQIKDRVSVFLRELINIMKGV